MCVSHDSLAVIFRTTPMTRGDIIIRDKNLTPRFYVYVFSLTISRVDSISMKIMRESRAFRA